MASLSTPSNSRQPPSYFKMPSPLHQLFMALLDWKILRSQSVIKLNGLSSLSLLGCFPILYICIIWNYPFLAALSIIWLCLTLWLWFGFFSCLFVLGLVFLHSSVTAWSGLMKIIWWAGFLVPAVILLSPINFHVHLIFKVLIQVFPHIASTSY